LVIWLSGVVSLSMLMALAVLVNLTFKLSPTESLLNVTASTSTSDAFTKMQGVPSSLVSFDLISPCTS